MELDTVLQNVLSSDQNVQKSAEQTLTSLLENSFGPTLLRLSEIAKTPTAQDVSRQSAVLVLKNAVSSKHAAIRAKQVQAWIQLEEPARNHIKHNILEALLTDTLSLSRSVAQCVSTYALCDIQRVGGGWPDVIPFLASTSMDVKSSSLVMQTALEAIGYICEDAGLDLVSAYSGQIVTAIITGMKKEAPSTGVRLAATSALSNSLDFLKPIFDRFDERNYIMTTICEATQTEDKDIRVAALQCLTKVFQIYYIFMQPYTEQALFPVSYQAMSSTEPDVVLQGVEFWSTICDEEIEMESEAADSGAMVSKSSRFVLGHLSVVVPYLLQLLPRQPEYDEDEWNPSKAASVCLTLISQCVKDDIVPHVVPFVANNINNGDWHYRDAACIAFGSILDGPDPEKLKGMVNQAYDVVLNLMEDSSVAVRDSAAWVVYRMCEFAGRDILAPERLQRTVLVLRQNLTGVPRVATNVCWALGALAQSCHDYVAPVYADNKAESWDLSPCFDSLLEELFTTGFRPDSAQNNLRTAAFETIGRLVRLSPKDCYQSVQRVAVKILGALAGIVEKEASLSGNERMQYGDFCQHLLGTLQVVIQRMVIEDLKAISNNVFALCLQFLELYRVQRSFQTEVEVFLFLQTLMEINPENFFNYVAPLNPYIKLAVDNYNEHTIANGALVFLAEIFRNYEAKMLQFVPTYYDTVTRLISKISDPSGLVTPAAVTTLGDMALSIRCDYLPFAVRSFECLRSVTIPQDPDVWLALLEAILDACNGIIHGIKSDNGYSEEARALMRQYVPFILPLLESAGKQLPILNDSCIGNCANIIGALCEMFGQETLLVVDREDFRELLTKGKQQRGTRVQKFCSATLKAIKKLKTSALDVPTTEV